jgi:ferrous iron transport protein A
VDEGLAKMRAVYQHGLDPARWWHDTVGRMQADERKALTMYLDALPRGSHAVIAGVEHRGDADPVATRLLELGFVPGESVQMIAFGPIGSDPVAVRLGSTRFALRRVEAGRVRLRDAA